MTIGKGLRSALAVSCFFGAVHGLGLACLLLYPDLNLSYPFMGGDSFDWISQALRFAGEDVRHPGRPPLLPLVMAGLEKMSALNLTPVLLQVLIAFTAVVLFRTVAGQWSPTIALPVTFAFFVNFSWRALGLEIMADVPAACLILIALGAFLTARDRPTRYALAGLFGGLSAITQPVALMLVVPMCCAIFFHRRKDLRTRWPWLGLALFAGPTLLWIPIRWVWLGSSGSTPLHWSLLGLHPGNVLFYLWTGAAFVGLPGLALALWGFGLLVRRVGRDPRALLFVMSAVLCVGFFAGAYGFAGKRFLVYAFVLTPFFWAEGLSRIRRVVPFTLACLVLIGWSWLPYPGRASSPLRLAVWPAPATYLVASPDQRPRGDVRPDFAAITIERSGSLLRRSVIGRAWAARKKVVPGHDVDVAGSDASAVLLAGSEEELSRRYVTVARVGNALRRRVKMVSREQLQPFADTLPLRPVGRVPGWQVFRTRLPGIDQDFLVVFASGEGPLQKTRADSPATERNEEVSIRQTARGLIARLPVNDDVVAVLSAPGANDRLLTYLACLAHSTNFYVITTVDPSETLRELGCKNSVLLGAASEIVVDSCELLDYQATVVLLP